MRSAGTASARRAADSAVAPQTASSTYRCWLEEQPTFLVPPRLLERAAPPRSPLIVNPRVWFSWSGPPPAEFARWFAVFHSGQPGCESAWISDAATGALTPFWLQPATRSLLETAASSGSAPASIEPQILAALRAARILVSLEEEARRKAEWDSAVESARLQYEKGYAPFAGLIHPFHIGALRRYFRQQLRTGAFPLGDGQSDLRHVAHNEPVARFFHHQLAGVMSRIAGEPVKPSYVYFASYQGGAELDRHTDRKQCEFSITYCLDFTPEPVAAAPWPIRLDTPSGRVTVYQAVGDALLYRGCRLPHYRRRLWKGSTSSSFFFHFVRESFRGKLN